MTDLQRPTGRQGVYLIAVLTIANAFSYLDRQVINILAEPIRREFDLRDWQIGALTGLAFGLVYIGATIPIGRLAERFNRPRLISLFLAFWSACTVLCAGVQNFAQLALARAGLGLGEAGMSPAAQSLIVDAVPPSRRALALSILTTGVPIGSMIGMALGGVIADRYGWRSAFLICGAPGLLLVVATWFMRDPRGKQAGERRTVPNFRNAFRELWNKPSFRLVLIAASLMTFLSLAQNAFHSAYLIRAHEPALAAFGAQMPMPMGALAFLGVALGVGSGIIGILGTLAGGWVTDHLVARHGPQHYLTVLIASAIASVPFAVATVVVKDPLLAVACACLTSFTRSFSAGATVAAVQSLARTDLRATASALLMFSLNLVGLALGPLGVGALSDLFAMAGQGPVGGLRSSLLTVEVLAAVAVILFVRTRRTYRRDYVG